MLNFIGKQIQSACKTMLYYRELSRESDLPFQSNSHFAFQTHTSLKDSPTLKQPPLKASMSRLRLLVSIYSRKFQTDVINKLTKSCNRNAAPLSENIQWNYRAFQQTTRKGRHSRKDYSAFSIL